MTNYEKTFKDDYNYLSDAYKHLVEMVDNWETLEAKPNCPRDLLENQLDAMYNLLKIMETRADTEGIKL